MLRRELLEGALAAAAVAAGGRVAGAAARPVRVAAFGGRGVHPLGLARLRALVGADAGLRLTVVSAAAIRAGALAEAEVVVFSGGLASAQARDLGEVGRERVREFVAGSGGYLGVCAGASLALQGQDPTGSLSLVAGRHQSAGPRPRGVAPLRLAADGVAPFRLRYADGPIFAPVPGADLPACISLARFVDEVYHLSFGTCSRPMTGAPAIVAAGDAGGRVLLFSPDPTLGGRGVARPDLARAGLRWVAAGGPVPADISFLDVFPGAPIAGTIGR